MNAKFAKKLRKLARADTRGLPQRSHNMDQRGVITGSEFSTRGVYRLLKKAV